MISALDTSVILDVLVGKGTYCDPSMQAIRKARSEGKLIVCECVVAEVFPTLENEQEVAEFMLDWQIHFVPLSLESAMLAGSHFRTYLDRGGSQKRVLADFLIGAHAKIHAGRLIARDRGYLRDYFDDLQLVDPAAEQPKY
jgi:predicted nucleic acid-binding protein